MEIQTQKTVPTYRKNNPAKMYFTQNILI